MSALIQAGEDTARRLSDKWVALDVGWPTSTLGGLSAARVCRRGAMGRWSGTWRAVRDNGTAVAVSQLRDMLVKDL